MAAEALLPESENEIPNEGEKQKSLTLDVLGELVVPNLGTEEELREILNSDMYVLDLSKVELRMSGNIRRRFCDLMELDSTKYGPLVSHFMLRGIAARTNPEKRQTFQDFMRKGSQAGHFSVLRSLSKERRAELERSAKPPMPPPVRSRSNKMRSVSSSSMVLFQKSNTEEIETMTGFTPEHHIKGEQCTFATVSDKETMKHPTHDELSTFRSITTASGLHTSRTTHEGEGSQ